MANINGNSANNNLTGTFFADVIKGFDGDDRLDGGAGSDRLEGGNGNDVLIGGIGNDTLLGGAGNDTIDAGGINPFESDLIDFRGAGDVVIIGDLFFTENAGVDKVTGIFTTDFIATDDGGIQFSGTAFNDHRANSSTIDRDFYTGDAPESLQKANNDFLPGTGIPASGFEIAEANQGPIDVQTMGNVAIRRGAEIALNSDDGNGNYDVTVPEGSDPGASNRPAWVMHIGATAGDDGNGPVFGTKFGDVNLGLDIGIDFDSDGNIDVSAELNLYQTPGGQLYLANAAGNIVQGLVMNGNSAVADTTALFPGFLAALGGDADPNTPGDQPYAWGAGATVYLGLSTEIVGTNIQLTDQDWTIHVGEDVSVL